MIGIMRVFVVSIVAATAVAAALVFAADEKGKKDLMGAFLNGYLAEQLHELEFVPEIEDGVVVGQSARAAKLLEYVVADYREHLGKGIDGMCYVLVAGIEGSRDLPAIGKGQFRKGDGPKAGYIFAIGSEVNAATRAALISSYTNRKGIEYKETVLRWSGTDGKWTLARSSGPGPIPTAIQKISQIK